MNEVKNPKKPLIYYYGIVMLVLMLFNILTDKEKWTVAYHEIGHALVAAKQTNSAPVQKITIIPPYFRGFGVHHAG